MTDVFFFFYGWEFCALQHRRDGFSLITITPMGVGKPYNGPSWLSFNEVSIVKHVWGFPSWDFLERFFCSSMVSCFLVNTTYLKEWCDSMTLNQSYVFFITLLSITYQSRNQYLPSIHSWDRESWWVLCIPLFLIFCFFVFFFLFMSKQSLSSHETRKVSRLLYLFCFLSWHCGVIIYNLVTFLQFPRYLQFSLYIAILT